MSLMQRRPDDAIHCLFSCFFCADVFILVLQAFPLSVTMKFASFISLLGMNTFCTVWYVNVQ